MKNFISIFHVLFGVFVLINGQILAQTGTISGRILTKQTNEPLPGANISLIGTNLGATSNKDGFYLISNVRPGTYQVRASFLGYTRTTVENVRVRVNLATKIDFVLQEEVLQGEEITVVAERKNIIPEVSASMANVDAENLESLPIATLEDAIKLQAGVEPDLTIRGGNINSVSFMIDGVNLREGRTNAPIMGLSYTALEQMQVQTGGFNAEFGNVRSGLVQFVTKNPPRDRYSVDAMFRYRPSQNLSFEDSETTSNIDFAGYDADVTFGGPVFPKNEKLRFLASFRQNQTPYTEIYDRDQRRDRTAQLKLVSEIKPGLKLTLTGLSAAQRGVADSIASMLQAGVPSYPWGFDNDFFKREGLFKLDNIGLSDIDHNLIAASLTHTLDPNTFFEFKANRIASDYFLRPGPQELIVERDTSSVVVWTTRFDLTKQISSRSQFKAGLEYIVSDYNISSEINDACATRVSTPGSAHALLCGSRHDFESPYRIFENWRASPKQGAAYVQGKFSFNGMILNPGLRFDYFNSGAARFVFDDFSPLLGQENPGLRNDSLATESPKRQFALSPRFGASFPVTENSKLYFNYGLFRQMPQAQHLFRLQEQSYFAERSSLVGIGNPNIPMARTAAYEFGFEQNLSEQFLLTAAAYLRDVDKQTSFRAFVSENVNYTIELPFNYNDVSGLELALSKTKGSWLRGFVNFTFMSFNAGNFGPSAVILNPIDENEYERITQDHYESKAASQPFAHFNLELLSPSDFGPKIGGGDPFADWRINLLGQWRAGKVFTWGGPIVDEDDATGGVQYSPHPSLRNNVRTRDFYSLDLRLSRKFQTGSGAIQFFADFNNLLNLKFMYFERSFAIGDDDDLFADYNDYMSSLRLPADAFENLEEFEIPYILLPGKDRPGDVRKPGVDFVPIHKVLFQRQLPNSPRSTENAVELYYVRRLERHMQYVDGAWQTADPALVRQVLADKAYIDMPDKIAQTFLNPRSLSFGLRVSF